MIKIEHAHKYYNRSGATELHVMNDINLELPEKGLVAVFGKSGCGKTTFLNAVGGLDRLSSGTITVFGEDMGVDTDVRRNKYIGCIFQNYNLAKNETVFENVADALRLCGMEDENEIHERVLASLRNVGMARFEKRMPDTLSGGQQQRVAIARAIVKNPAIILADEPTGNLDEANTILVMDILKKISENNLVVLVTHEENLVDRYCDRVIELVDGRVHTDRENKDANGYEEKDRNDIFLGELEKTEGNVGNVHIEYYGAPNEDVKLRIVSVGGRLYLKSDTEKLRIIDSSSEIRLREGSFEKKNAASERQSASFDMTSLKPFEGKKFGKLFTFKSAVKSGYRGNFAKKGMKGRKVLRLSMFMLACVAVFMTASFAVSIRSLTELKKNNSDNDFFLVTSNPVDLSSALNDADSGIDYVRLLNGSYRHSLQSFSFNIGNFITADASQIDAQGYIVGKKLSDSMKIVCGKRDFERQYDALITTAVADEMIEKSPMSFIDDYTDLLNMTSPLRYNGEYLRIVGIVESNEKFLFLNQLQAASIIMNDAMRSLAALPYSMSGMTGEQPERGEVQLYSTGDERKTGSQILVMGRNYTISEIVRSYSDTSDYEQFVLDSYGEKLMGENEYIDANPDKDDSQMAFEWFFDYFTKYYREFVGHCLSPDYQSWMYGRNGEKAFLIDTFSNNYVFSFGATELYGAYLYKKDNGVYPTKSELNEYLGDDWTVENAYYDVIYMSNELWAEYESSSKFNWYNSMVVMNDEDYAMLPQMIGESDESISSNKMFDNDFKKYYNFLIHATDPVAANEYLSKNFGAAMEVVTPEMKYNESRDEAKDFIVDGLISLAVIIALMCVCVFFIMRSSLMSRVKEIGIYRAIGVSRKNLMYRFAIESAVVSTLSLFIGFVFSTYAVIKLSAVGMFAESLYMPAWLIATLFVLLYGITVLFGTLPVGMLTRKTPSEILAKYDI